MRFKRLDFDDMETQIRAALPDGWAVGPAGSRVAPFGKRGWHIYGPFRTAPVGSIWQYRLGRFRANFEAMVLTQWGPVRSLHREPSVAAVWVVSVVTDEMRGQVDAPKRCKQCGR